MKPTGYAQWQDYAQRQKYAQWQGWSIAPERYMFHHHESEVQGPWVCHPIGFQRVEEKAENWESHENEHHIEDK